jgi:hypothetical protein
LRYPIGKVKPPLDQDCRGAARYGFGGEVVAVVGSTGDAKKESPRRCVFGAICDAHHGDRFPSADLGWGDRGE